MSAKQTSPENSQPDAPAYREVTLAAVIFGLVVGAIMNASITYAGLKIGFTLVGSAIAAVLGYGILRGALRRGSILEINIGQTIASAVNTPNAGVIFTVPVLFLLGIEINPFGEERQWMDEVQVRFLLITLACTVGAILGCAFIIPLRKQMIDIDRLRFPTGTAVAAILKSPGAGPKKSIVLLVGMLVAAAIYIPTQLPMLSQRVLLEDLEAAKDAGYITQADVDRTKQIHEWITSGSPPANVVNFGGQLDQAIKNGELEEAKADKVALIAYRIANDIDGTTWEDLKDEAWAEKPGWGYSRLDFRLRDPREDIVGGAESNLQLERRVDRDADGRPDLILTDDTIDVGRLFGFPDQIQFMFAIAPFALGAGYLSGRAGFLVLAGGILAYFVLNPIAYSMSWMPATTTPWEAPEFAHGAFNRPLGIGMLLGGALMGVVASLPAIFAAFRQIGAAQAAASRSAELNWIVLAAAGLIGGLLLFAATDQILDSGTESDGLLAGQNRHLQSLVVAAIGTAWIWFAGIIIAQCTGMTDWSPISGISLITIVLVMALIGTDQVLGAVLIGAALCTALTCSADMMADLKTGHLVGASPRRQQILELATTGLGPLICMITLMVIVSGNMEKFKIPIGEGTDTTAPQAQALEAIINGIQGGEMPYALYGFGAVLGVLMGLGSFAGLGVLVGLSMYLPVIFILTYGIGCIANIVIGKIKGQTWAEEWGVPFSAGLIVGESLLNLCFSAIVLLRGS